MIRTPDGITAIASVTELRTDLTALMKKVHTSGGAVLITSNNNPFAVLLTPKRYEKLIEEAGR